MARKQEIDSGPVDTKVGFALKTCQNARKVRRKTSLVSPPKNTESSRHVESQALSPLPAVTIVKDNVIRAQLSCQANRFLLAAMELSWKIEQFAFVDGQDL